MKVCIAEKPNVAKSIAKVLGVNQPGDGYIEGYSDLLKDQVCVTWTFGHLCELKTPGEYNRRWKNWNFNNLPMFPPKFQTKVKEEESVQHQFNVIKKLLDECDECVNCGDAGQEGELIQRFVLQQSGFKKPVKRLWISSLTDEAIKKGFKNLEDSSKYDNIYKAALCRSIGDWLVGMNATQYQTLKYGLRNILYSVGRVQTPTLSLIVQRQKEIDEFVSEKYYDFTSECNGAIFSGNSTFKDKKEANEKYKSLKDLPMKITKIETKTQQEKAPQLFDLTSLQVEMNKKYGCTAEDTLSDLQSLYESQLVTYPRVDTRYLPKDTFDDCKKILNNLSNMYRYQDCCEELLEEIKLTKDIFNDDKVTDHHAIIPTGRTPGQLSDDQLRLFDAIVKRFLCNFSKPCITSNTYIEGMVGDELMKTSGRQILQKGWRVVYGGEMKDEILPEFEKKDYKQKLKLNEHTTKAPNYYTEATLLRAMETAGKLVGDEELSIAMKENGIGRPSTRAAIIELLFKRGYIIRDKKNIKPTPTGIFLVNHIEDPILKSPELTGQWESKLRKIEKGEYDIKQFKEELYEFVKNIVKNK